MCFKRHWSSVCFWIFLVLLHFVASRHAQETLTLSDQNTEEENLKVKVKKSLKAKTDIKLQDVNSCDCRDYCPDPNSTELQVRFRKFYITTIILIIFEQLTALDTFLHTYTYFSISFFLN